MKLNKQLSLCSLLIISVGILTTGCQKTQKASAQEVATQFGDAQGPLAEGDAAAAAALNAPGTPPATADSSRNRFGFAGADAPVKPLRRDTSNHSQSETPIFQKKEVVSAPKVEKKLAPPKLPPAPKNTSPIVKLGFANTVPNDPLHVTLPNEYASLGPVSVERMDPAGNSLGSPWARGTQMQIPNPKVSGGKIYFKVP